MRLEPGTYWITRDSDLDGKPSDVCDVWTKRPTRYLCEISECGVYGAFWMTGDFDLSQRYGDKSHTAASVFKMFRVLPDDDRQCIRVEIG